jgi:O-antigen ligase
LTASEQWPLRLALAVIVAVAGFVSARWISRRLEWPEAGPLGLIAATPFVPSAQLALGISTDDILPAMGAILCLLAVRRRGRRPAWPLLLTLGAGCLAIAGLIASVANASDAVAALQMGLKSVGHLVFLGLVGTAAMVSLPEERRRLFVARAMAAVGTAEAGFSVVAWLLPLPANAGIEPSRQMTSLLGHVPGRVAGTTGLSPNFLGAVFILTIALTVALALRPAERSRRALWWGSVVIQIVALALTFTRTSLVITIAMLVVLLLARGHGRILLGLAAVVLVIALATPLGSRLLGDSNDRAALWTSAVRMMIDHPLTGVGPGRTLTVAAANPARYQMTEFGLATNNAHNTILLAGAETGVLGAIGAVLVNLAVLLCALSASIPGLISRAHVRGGVASPSRDDLCVAAGLGTIGFLVQGMTNNLFAVEVTSVVATLVVGAFLLPGPSLSALFNGIRAPLNRRSGPAG